MLSKRFIEKLKLWHEPQYQVALKAGIHPSLLSKWVIGAQTVHKNDERIERVAEIIGLPKTSIFQKETI